MFSSFDNVSSETQRKLQIKFKENLRCQNKIRETNKDIKFKKKKKKSIVKI